MPALHRLYLTPFIDRIQVFDGKSFPPIAPTRTLVEVSQIILSEEEANDPD